MANVLHRFSDLKVGMMDEPGFLARSADTDFLANGGEMAELVRLKDWSLTPLGPIGDWPQSLRTTVSLCLASSLPMNIVWGSQHSQIYNDGYRLLCGERHPEFLGMSYAVSCASAWPAMCAPFARALDGETSLFENERMFLRRNGHLEETFFTFSLSPIRDETGDIGGLFHPITETTATMLGERRTRAVCDLTARLGGARTAGEVFGLAVDVLADFAFDLPFVLLYCLDSTGSEPARYKLAAQTGLHTGTGASPWPVEGMVHLKSATLLPHVAGHLGACGPYEEPPVSVFVVPVRLAGVIVPAAFLVAATSPRLLLDDAYRRFYDHVAAAVAAALATAKAFEEESRRAETLAALHHAKTVEPYGHEVVAVGDGVAASADAQRRPSPDVVPTDVMMPGLDRAALRESEHRLEFALTAGHLGSWELDLVTHGFVCSDICRDIFGLAPSDRLEDRDDLQDRLHPDERARGAAALAGAIETRTIFDFECRIIRPDAEVAWVQARGHASYAGDGTPLSMVGVLLDVTERKRHEARQLLLLDELNHRVKNTLATVQSIAMQTQRSAKSPGDFRQDLSARIAALARAHNLLTRASWDGALLNDVIDQTLAPHMFDASGMQRVEAGGPRVRLGPNAVISLNMAFHELATNAVKYGALSTPRGKVRLHWRAVRTGETVQLEIVWQETHGPLVEAPREPGFGFRLIEKGLPGEFGGEVRVEFNPEGVCCRMLFPVSSKIMVLD